MWLTATGMARRPALLWGRRGGGFDVSVNDRSIKENIAAASRQRRPSGGSHRALQIKKK